MSDDPWHLARFLEARARNYPDALAELRLGQKRTHWIWYVFPQVRGLGLSPASQKYGLSGLEEARAYLAHPVLGARLRECVDALLSVRERTAFEIFGGLDSMKVRSSMTLFAEVSPPGSRFHAVIARYFADAPDPITLDLLAAGGASA